MVDSCLFADQWTCAILNWLVIFVVFVDAVCYRSGGSYYFAALEVSLSCKLVGLLLYRVVCSFHNGINLKRVKSIFRTVLMVVLLLIYAFKMRKNVFKRFQPCCTVLLKKGRQVEGWSYSSSSPNSIFLFFATLPSPLTSSSRLSCACAGVQPSMLVTLGKW